MEKINFNNIKKDAKNIIENVSNKSKEVATIVVDKTNIAEKKKSSNCKIDGSSRNTAFFFVV